MVFTQWKKNSLEISVLQDGVAKILNETRDFVNQISSLQKNINKEKQKLSDLDEEKNNLNDKFIKLNSEINKYGSQLEGITNRKIEVSKFLTTIQNDFKAENERHKELKEYIENLEKKISEPVNLNHQKKNLLELTSQETQLKNSLKQLETIYVNEIQLSLGEEFKSGNLKESKEIKNKKKNDLKEIINVAMKKQIAEEKEYSNQKKINEKIELDIKHLQNLITKKKSVIKNASNQNQELGHNINQLDDQIDIFSKRLTQIETELKTLNLLANNNLSKHSIVNVLKIKKGYENSIYAALTMELDATLNESPKRWVKINRETIPIENSIAKYVEGPDELNLILSQIGFIDNAKFAKEKQKQLKTGQCLVDINGSIWRWDGFISEDNLQRKKLIDAQLKIKKLVDEQVNFESKLKELKNNKTHLLAKQSKYSEILSEGNNDLEKLYKNSDSNYSQLTNSKQKLSIIKFNVENSKKKLKSLSDEYNLIIKDLENIKRKEESSNKNDNGKNDIQKEIQELDIRIEKKREEINSIKESIMKEELNETYYKNDLQKSKARIQECEKQISTLKKREVSYLSESKKLEQLPKSLKESLDNVKGLSNEVQEKISLNNQKNEIKQLLNNEETKIMNLNRQRELKVNEKTRIESSLQNHMLKDKEFRNLIFQQSRIQPEKFENNLESRKIQIQDYDEIKIKLERLINQREQMGPVNLRAKVEEDLVNKSIEELELEKLDLSQAIDKLRIAINKINNEGRNRLFKAYEKVNNNFSDLFQKLFNGGEAKLELIKSDDPLQTGIEIYARPPGKKLSSISLLSGGEKALTAISLIFSIFLINPSPICILDEVDAALDDPNVEKFCNILLELKKETKTKFLIITHHKTTMTSIDRVYGVTMAQKGISDIVSVDFEKIDLQEAV